MTANVSGVTMNGERELNIQKNVRTAKAGDGRLLTVADTIKLQLRIQCPWMFDTKKMNTRNEPVNPNWPTFEQGSCGHWLLT